MVRETDLVMAGETGHKVFIIWWFFFFVCVWNRSNNVFIMYAIINNTQKLQLNPNLLFYPIFDFSNQDILFIFMISSQHMNIYISH